VSIWCEVEHMDLTIPGVRVLSSREFRTQLEVDSRSTTLGQVVDAASRQGTIRDLEVEETPLDVVIRALYANADGSGVSP
jgi:hypothetical protein